MNYRSWLIVAGNNEKRLGNAVGTGADAVVVDLIGAGPLDDAVATRRRAAEWLDAHKSHVIERKTARWVRINPMEAGSEWRQDLVAVIPTAPDGIILPRAAGPEAVRQLAAELYELEQHHHVPANSTRIIPQVGATARSALAIGQFLETGHQRLFGLAWEADELARSMGATRTQENDGVWTDTIRAVRAQVLLTAHACGVLALDTVSASASDKKALKAAVSAARADGFSGMIANQADRVAAINEAFAPSKDELRDARDIVAAFDNSPVTGVLSFQGRMIDKPQLKQARRTLGMEEATASDPALAASILRPA